MLRGEDQFHTGVVVDDVDAAKDLLTESAGYRWPEDIEIEQPVRLADGRDMTVELRLVYSLTEPRIELVRAVADTPFQPAPGSGIHHLGYWCDDVAASVDELGRRGWAFEMGGVVSAEAMIWAYCTNPTGFRVELVDQALRPGLETWWETGSMTG